MKNKVKARVINHKRKVKKCYFCGKPPTSRHHIIPRRLGGKGMKNNKVDICDNCHKKLHAILDPPIDYLLMVIQRLAKLNKPEIRKIGFVTDKKEEKK